MSDRPAVAATYLGRGLPRPVKALGATSFLQDVASEMVYPLLPGFLAALGGGPVALGVMESAAEGVLALVKGAAGRWSDRAGRRKPFVSAGYGLSALCRPLMAVAATPLHVIGLRALDRVAKGLRTAPRDAMISDSVGREQRGFAFSFHRGLDHLGAAVGPLLAALVLLAWPGDLRRVFLLATLPAIVGWLVVQVFCAEPPHPAAAVARPGVRATLPAGLRGPLLAFLLFSLGNASDAFLLLRAAQLGFGAAGLAVLWSGFHVAKWLASAPAGRLADRLGPRPQIFAGWTVYAAVYLGFAWAHTAFEVVALFGLYAVFYGLTEGAERALVVDLAGASMGTGTALGAYHLATGVGVFAASLIFGLLWQEVSPVAAFVVGAALAGAAAALLAITARRQRTV
ncbi:MAG: MFS transporter [Acidobacteriota bacterium]